MPALPENLPPFLFCHCFYFRCGNRPENPVIKVHFIFFEFSRHIPLLRNNVHQFIARRKRNSFSPGLGLAGKYNNTRRHLPGVTLPYLPSPFFYPVNNQIFKEFKNRSELHKGGPVVFTEYDWYLRMRHLQPADIEHYLGVNEPVI